MRNLSATRQACEIEMWLAVPLEKGVSWLTPQEIRPKLSKQEFRERSGSLRNELLAAQAQLRETKTPVVVLIGGVDGAGKGESVDRLNAWLDPRWIRTRAFDSPSDEETERPHFWRYWRALPFPGETALFLSAWYSSPLLQRVEGSSTEVFAAQAERIRRFEETLTAGGCRILKIWLHLTRDGQIERFRELENDPLRSWRVTERDWQNCSLYPRFAAATEELLDATHTDSCPWVVIDGQDPRQRDLDLGEAVLGAFRGASDMAQEQGPNDDPPPPSAPPKPLCEQTLPVNKNAYRAELAELQGRVNQLHREAWARGISVIGVFEGRDAAGKGGAIRRTVPAFDARRVDVVRVGPPSDEEQAHHYLWRFWRRLPRAGHVTLFDRSWYGRVLVERVEGLIGEPEWRRAYGEINDFENQLVEHGILLAKFWLEISWEEQEKRFAERREVPHKQWKLTEDDVRNRGFWQEYDAAIVDALARTDTNEAPWIVVPGGDKRSTRLTVLRSLCQQLEQRLDGA